MEDGDEHFGCGEGAVAADEAVEMRFSGVIKAHWRVGDKRYVACLLYTSDAADE